MRCAIKAALALLAISGAAIAAQETPPPADTDPEAASSPHQREATSMEETRETPAAKDTDPSAASSPHQRQTAKGGDQAQRGQMVQDCIKRQQSQTPQMSLEQARKTCIEQMKTREREHR